MGLNLWWVQNDGITGHVWLSIGDMLALRDEMLAQGMAWEGGEGRGIPTRKLLPRERETITAEEIAQALAAALPVPAILADRKLWEDWLAFLAGARIRGGIVVRS